MLECRPQNMQVGEARVMRSLTRESSKHSGHHLKLALFSIFPQGPGRERELLSQQEGFGGQQAELRNKSRRLRKSI